MEEFGLVFGQLIVYRMSTRVEVCFVENMRPLCCGKRICSHLFFLKEFGDSEPKMLWITSNERFTRPVVLQSMGAVELRMRNQISNLSASFDIE